MIHERYFKMLTNKIGCKKLFGHLEAVLVGNCDHRGYSIAIV